MQYNMLWCKLVDRTTDRLGVKVAELGHSFGVCRLLGGYFPAMSWPWPLRRDKPGLQPVVGSTNGDTHTFGFVVGRRISVVLPQCNANVTSKIAKFPSSSNSIDIPLNLYKKVFDQSTKVLGSTCTFYSRPDTRTSRSWTRRKGPRTTSCGRMSEGL